MMLSPASSVNNHRLLYRGALELPDSYILLDGLSFTLQLGPKDNRPKSSPSMDLLQNPLPLALESMRGRPSLQFLGTTKVKDVFVDSSCDANVYIHPKSTLTQIYFENILCLSPVMSDRKTDYGIRVGLGDQNAPGSSEILIYGSLPSNLLSDPPGVTSELQLFATRIVPTPPPTIRLPRPDDPTPRKPPLVVFGEKQGQKMLKQKHSKATHPPKLGFSRTASSKFSFKVPDLPKKTERTKSEGGDVFGSASTSKGKSKAKDVEINPADLDKNNKVDVKKSAVRNLEKYGIIKEHPDFKEMFGFVYRGASFALRRHMNSRTIESRIIDQQVEMHVQMYVRGDGVSMKLA